MWNLQFPGLYESCKRTYELANQKTYNGWNIEKNGMGDTLFKLHQNDRNPDGILTYFFVILKLQADSQIEVTLMWPGASCQDHSASFTVDKKDNMIWDDNNDCMVTLIDRWSISDAPCVLDTEFSNENPVSLSPIKLLCFIYSKDGPIGTLPNHPGTDYSAVLSYSGLCAAQITKSQTMHPVVACITECRANLERYLKAPSAEAGPAPLAP